MKFRTIPYVDTAVRAEIDQIAKSNFDRTIMAVRRNEAYCEQMPGLRGVRTIDDIANLPLTTAEFVANHSPPNSTALACTSRDSGVVLATGGTTGQKKTFYHSWDSFRMVMEIGARSIMNDGASGPRKVANCFLPGSLWGGFLFGQGVVEAINGQLFALGRPSEAELLDVIHQHGVNTFFSSPSYAATIFSEGNRLEPALQRLTHFYYVGEAVSPSLSRSLAANYPNLKIRSLAYTTNETGPIGYQCGYQTGGDHHVNEDAVHIEILDVNNPESDTPGEGEIVVSTIANDGMPLFRYRTGDRGHFVDAPCPCGTAFKTITLTGRVGNSVNICGVLVSDAVFLNAFGNVSATELQVIITSVGGRIDVDILIDDGADCDGSLVELEQRLRSDGVLKGALTETQFGQLRLRRVNSREFILNERTGKKKFFVALA